MKVNKQKKIIRNMWKDHKWREVISTYPTRKNT